MQRHLVMQHWKDFFKDFLKVAPSFLSSLISYSSDQFLSKWKKKLLTSSSLPKEHPMRLSAQCRNSVTAARFPICVYHTSDLTKYSSVLKSLFTDGLVNSMTDEYPITANYKLNKAYCEPQKFKSSKQTETVYTTFLCH